MLIDWFTVIAQAINFLVLMFLLRRFLYRPVLNAIDAREAHIVETVKNAEGQKAEAEKERELFAKKNEDFDRQRADLVNKAREDAKTAGERLLEKERQAVDASREKWRNALADEQKHFGEEAVGRIQEEIFATVRQVLSDLADASLEDRMVEAFCRRLRLAANAPGDKLAEALRAAPATILVKSAFDLSAEQQETLRQTLSESLPASAGVKVGFETAPNLVGGIELILDGQKAAWTIDDYLARLKSSVSGPSDSPPSSQGEEGI